MDNQPQWLINCFQDNKIMKKILKIIGIILAIIITIGILGYSKFVGFTKKSKYKNCAETCEKIMFNKSNIPACKTECKKITGYTPISESEPSFTKPSSTEATEVSVTEPRPTEPPKPKTKKPDTTTTETTVAPQSAPRDKGAAPQSEYHCEWSWPQKIIIRDTKKVIFECPSEKPWCDYADRQYKNVGCCTDYDEDTKTKSNCTKLPELLKKELSN